MRLDPPPIQQRIANVLLPQTWILWFQSIRTSLNSIFSDTESLKDRMGWAFYDDSTYTSSNKLRANNAKVQVTIDEAGSSNITDYLPEGVTFFANDKITPENIGDTYGVRFDFIAEASSPNDKFDIVVDIGGSNPEIYRQTVELLKASGVAEKFGITINLFSLNTFVTNGGEIYLDTSVSGDDVSFYNLGLFITRISKVI